MNGDRIGKKKKFARRAFELMMIAVLALCLTLTSACSSIGDYFDALTPNGNPFNNGSSNSTNNSGGATIAQGSLQIHFIELGNKYTGDCTYIRAGDKDILIDAGSRTSSIETIDKYLSNYVKDGKLEYVIVTHAHQDHYAGFATNVNTQSLFDLYECEVIIDFAQITSSKADTTMYKNYIRERDDEIAAGAVHYTAKECVENDNKGVFELGDGISLEILDSYYYHNRSSNENNHSVCTLIKDGANSYLFTGDLEKEGEEYLVELNKLPEVKLYKAGHHGSKTSSNEVLLEVIKPEIVCVCCCCGSSEYTDTVENQFPTQAFIDRISVYTDKVYVTTLCVDYDKGEFASMNGNIVVCLDNGAVTVSCSASNEVLKNTQWFSQNRSMPNAWK